MPTTLDPARVRVGICSWADPALIAEGTFYPARSMSAAARLRYYASVFDTVEINSSYYAIPPARNAVRWVERTPPGFLFNVKAYALLTGHHPRAETLPAELAVLLPRHPRRTRRGELDRSNFSRDAIDQALALFRDALRPMAEAGKLGYVLFQLAPWVRFSDAALAYLTSLPARLPGWAIAVETRDASWFPDHADETLKALEGARLAHVVVDAPTVPNAVPRVVASTAPTAVLRLHGRNADGWLKQLHGGSPSVQEKYDYLYTEDELRELARDVETLSAEAERVIVSFNNNNRDYPVRNARTMCRLLGGPGPAPR